MEPNILLDSVLDEAGISHAGLAAHINEAGRARGMTLRYEHTAVARWLKGQRPRGQVPDLICEVLGERLRRALTLDDIGLGTPGSPRGPATPLSGFVERATALWRSDEQQRPHILSAPAVTGTPAVIPVWEWENPPEDSDVSRHGLTRVSMTDIDMLRAARTHYEQMYRKAGGVATRARVVGFLNSETAPLLRGSYPDDTGRQLHRATGGLVAVAGICAYDSDAHGLAQRYFHQALRLAKASGDRGLGAYVIALLVNQSLFTKEYRQAVAFAESALRAAGPPHITPALAADLYAMQAKSYARLGDGASALACIRRAEAAADRIRPGQEPDETGYVQPGLVNVQVAEALLSLGDVGGAREHATAAVGTPAHDRGRVHRLAMLTHIELRQGDADKAVVTAVEMTERARGMESRRLRDRLRAVREHLAESGCAATSEAAELIDGALRVPL